MPGDCIMKRSLIIPFAILAFVWPRPARPAQQVAFQTPTPGPDGKIVYIVQEGDALWTIAALAEITVEELQALNGIQAGDFISPGMELLLGFGGPALATPAPQDQPSPTPEVTATEQTIGQGDICVLLFLDANGNARMEAEELPLSEGAISVADSDGVVVGEHTSDETLEGFCFTNLVEGDYNVSAAVPADHNPTTTMNLPARLAAGEIKHVEFGAQPSAALRGEQPGDSGAQSPLLGILGLAMLVVAGALGYYASRMGKDRPRSLR
jgi:hypothetical protein